MIRGALPVLGFFVALILAALGPGVAHDGGVVIGGDSCEESDFHYPHFSRRAVIDRTDIDSPFGKNLTGPSVMKVPQWVDEPLGAYYMYFANHIGKEIRLAFANDPLGPWEVYSKPVLELSELKGALRHVASPEAVIDWGSRQFYLFVHSPIADSRGQKTFTTVSDDGSLFYQIGNGPTIDFPYVRVFHWDSQFWAVGRHSRSYLLFSSDTPEGEWLPQGSLPLGENVRHVGLKVFESTLLVAFSRVEESPESIYMVALDLTHFERNSVFGSAPVGCLVSAVYPFEGAALDPVASEPGPQKLMIANDVRDPDLFIDDGAVYLFYSVGGERGIAAGHIGHIDTLINFASEQKPVS